MELIYMAVILPRSDVRKDINTVAFYKNNGLPIRGTFVEQQNMHKSIRQYIGLCANVQFDDRNRALIVVGYPDGTVVDTIRTSTIRYIERYNVTCNRIRYDLITVNNQVYTIDMVID